MPDPQLYEEVKNILMDVLGVEAEEISPSANFFDDLGGESIDVIDLNFRCEKKFDISISFQDLSHARISDSEADGQSSEKAFNALRDRFPFLPTYAELIADKNQDVKSLFTVDAIAKTVEHAIAQQRMSSQERAKQILAGRDS